MGLFSGILSGGGGGLAGDLLSTGLKAFGTYQASKARREEIEDATDAAIEQRERELEIVQRNAELARQRAFEIGQEGKASERDLRINMIRNIGTVRAQSAANGLLVDDGPGTTPRLLVQDMIEAGELDIIRHKRNVEYQRREAIRQAESDTLQAGFLTENIDSIREAGSRTAGNINPFADALVAGVGGLTSSGRFNDLLLDAF